jgi:hypothetical protein
MLLSVTLASELETETFDRDLEAGASWLSDTASWKKRK